MTVTGQLCDFENSHFPFLGNSFLISTSWMYGFLISTSKIPSR